MGHASSDAVLDLLNVSPDGLEFRLGLDLLLPGTPLPEPPPANRGVWLQVAWPPPLRLGGSNWTDGLWLSNGSSSEDQPLDHRFDPKDQNWTRLGVFAPEDTPALDRPLRGTLIIDQPFSVPATTAAEAPHAEFTLMKSGEPAPEGPQHFLSTYYDFTKFEGIEVESVTAKYYLKDAVSFPKPVHGFVAASLTSFVHDGLTSTDYIIWVD